MAHFFRFFEIYKIFTLSHRSELKISRKFIIFVKILRIFWNFANFVEISRKSQRNLLKVCVQSGAKMWKSCRFRKIWKNAPFLAIVAVDTAENEPLKVWGLFHSIFNQLLRPTRIFFKSCDHAYWDLGLGDTHRTLILRRMLIRIRARPGGFLKKTFFSAFDLRSAGTHRMLIFRRMLIRIPPRRAPIASNFHIARFLKKCE